MECSHGCLVSPELESLACVYASSSDLGDQGRQAVVLHLSVHAWSDAIVNTELENASATIRCRIVRTLRIDTLREALFGIVFPGLMQTESSRPDADA